MCPYILLMISGLFMVLDIRCLPIVIFGLHSDLNCYCVVKIIKVP